MPLDLQKFAGTLPYWAGLFGKASIIFIGLIVISILVVIPNVKPALAVDVPVTVTIDHLVDLNQAEEVDFYPSVSIDGQIFTYDPTQASHDAFEDQDDISPGWVFTKVVDSNKGSIPISIAIWDEDAFLAGGDDHVDIFQGVGRSLDLTLDLASCAITGSINSACGEVITSTGLEDDRGSIQFHITTDDEPSIVRFDYCSKHPTSLICTGLQEVPRKPFVICCLPDPPVDLGIGNLKINESIVLSTSPNGSTIISKMPTELTGMLKYEGHPSVLTSPKGITNGSAANTSTTSMTNGSLANTTATNMGGLAK